MFNKSPICYGFLVPSTLYGWVSIVEPSQNVRNFICVACLRYSSCGFLYLFRLSMRSDAPATLHQMIYLINHLLCQPDQLAVSLSCVYERFSRVSLLFSAQCFTEKICFHLFTKLSIYMVDVFDLLFSQSGESMLHPTIRMLLFNNAPTPTLISFT